MAVLSLRFPSLDTPARHACIRWWAAKQLRLLGIRLEVQGTPQAAATLIVANHVSWLDIAAIHAACPQARFVSKSDVLHWPLIGRLVKGSGALFIERERRRDAMRVVHHMAQALAEGDTVAVFPEGTTGDGRTLLPFHANLLQAAISSGVPVQPLALRFSEPGQAVSPAVDFTGETTLLQSMWRVACAQGLHVRLEWCAVLISEGADRRALAERARADIAHRLPAPGAPGSAS
jgi:1-acyl-sn-glycerol-3-phosphate acyltransferase